MSEYTNHKDASPNHGIYGQPYQKSALDFIHIESLSDATELHNWMIQPHRHQDLTQFLFIEQGSGISQLSDSETTLSAPSIIIIPANEIHAFRIERNISGHLLTIADSFLSDLALLVREPLIEKSWSSPMGISLDQTTYEGSGLSRLMPALISEFNANHEARSAAIYAHISLILTNIIRLLQSHPIRENPISPDSRGMGLLSRFQRMCDERYRVSKSVSEYCRDLDVTERTLRRTTQRYLGVPPLQVIHDRVLLEAQRNLIYTTMSITHIAESLGYDDPAYFTRFFKRNMQLTPNQFRTSMHKED